MSRRVRYGAPSALIIVGFICAAVSTGTIGGALATVLVGVGLVLLLVFLFRDLGLSVEGKPRRTVPPIPPAPADADELGDG